MCASNIPLGHPLDLVVNNFYGPRPDIPTSLGFVNPLYPADEPTEAFGNVAAISVSFETDVMQNIFQEGAFASLNLERKMALFHRMEEVRAVALEGELTLQPFDIPETIPDFGQKEPGVRVW